jgi:hypothetical protein
MATKVATPSTNGTVQVGAEVPAIRREHMYLRLIGDSPLIVHRWSEKARRQMLDKQMKRAKTAKDAKDPAKDFADSLYVISGEPRVAELPDGTMGISNAGKCTFGFPTVGFKAAAVSACRDIDGAKMSEARGRFHVEGELAEIESPGPTAREDMVRVGMGTADIRYRAEFKQWAVVLSIVYNASAISAEQIVNYFNLAGFGVGVGEWRPEKDGSYGRFHVATAGE